VRSRFPLALILGSLTLSGCTAFNEGPISYAENERMNAPPDRAEAPGLAGKPKLQVAVRKALTQLFGENPRRIRVPPGTGLPLGGRRLAGWIQEGEGERKTLKPVKGPQFDPAAYERGQLKPELDPATGQTALTIYEGGYTLYRRHCLHCHGVSGDGNGPTADFLYPRPRDYRKGLFKFTSTATGAKPTRDDLRRTIRHGLVGTSMPAFDAQMKPEEIEQVIDYVIFLSMRGETELGLIDEAQIADESDPEPLSAETIQGVAETVFNKWKMADSQVLNPPVPKPPSSQVSVLRGKKLFLGQTPQKLECAGCHGPRAQGNGPSFVDMAIFEAVVFSHDVVPAGQWKSEGVTKRVEKAIAWRYQELKDAAEAKEHAAALAAGEEGPHSAQSAEPELEPFESFKTKMLTSWKDGSFDDWGNPLRPANLNLGMYKGGRRPIDIYWRIAKGINGAKMPAHASTLKPEEIWDLVNFVLALPYQPDLLRDAPTTVPPAKTTGSTVARR
jgi:mono/diheme cytochrome c family protein